MALRTLGQALGGGLGNPLTQAASGAFGRGPSLRTKADLFTLAFVGLDTLNAARAMLARLQTNLDDTRPLLRSLVPVLQRHYTRQYRLGTGWAADDPQTLLGKLSGRTLVDRGRLERSMTGGSENVVRVTKTGLFYGTSVEYAEFLARGARNTPPRDPARLNLNALQRDIDTAVGEFIAGNGGRIRLGI